MIGCCVLHANEGKVVQVMIRANDPSVSFEIEQGPSFVLGLSADVERAVRDVTTKVLEKNIIAESSRLNAIVSQKTIALDAEMETFLQNIANAEPGSAAPTSTSTTAPLRGSASLTLIDAMTSISDRKHTERAFAWAARAHLFDIDIIERFKMVNVRLLLRSRGEFGVRVANQEELSFLSNEATQTAIEVMEDLLSHTELFAVGGSFLQIAASMHAVRRVSLRTGHRVTSKVLPPPDNARWIVALMFVFLLLVTVMPFIDLSFNTQQYHGFFESIQAAGIGDAGPFGVHAPPGPLLHPTPLHALAVRHGRQHSRLSNRNAG